MRVAEAHSLKLNEPSNMVGHTLCADLDIFFEGILLNIPLNLTQASCGQNAPVHERLEQ